MSARTLTSALPTTIQGSDRDNYYRRESGRPGSGGRTWWAHFEFTRINIEPTILRKKIEEMREVGARLVNAATQE